MWSGGRGLKSLLVIHKHTKEEIIYQWEGRDVKWVGLRLSTVKIVKLHRNLRLQSVFHSLFYGLRPADSIVSPFIHFPRSHEKYCHCKILIDNLTGNQLLEALTLLWHMGINGVMEIVDGED